MEAAQAPPPGQSGTETRYRALRIIATVIRVFAFIVLVLGALGVVISAIAIGVSEDGGAAQGLAWLVGGALYVAFIALFLFAYAELIRLLMDLEANTRRTSDALQSRGL